MNTGLSGTPAGALADRARTTLHERRRLLHLMPDIGRPLLAALVSVNALAAGLPLTVTLVTGHLSGALIEYPAGTDASTVVRDLMLWSAVLATAVVGQQVSVPLERALAEIARRRVDLAVHQRIVRICLERGDLGPLEDPAVRDLLTEARRPLDHGWQTPGEACAAQLVALSRYGTILGLVTLLSAVTDWLVGVLLLAVVLLFRLGQVRAQRRYSTVWDDLAPKLRRSDYLRRIAIGAKGGKEVRLFGLGPWIADGYASVHQDWLGIVRAERRRILLHPFLRYTGIGLVALGLACLAVAAEAGRQHDLTGLVVSLQATVAAIMLAQFWPEADLQLIFGMRSVLATDRLEKAVASGSRPPKGEEARFRSPGASKDPSPPAPAVSFEDVSFTYPGSERPVLRSLTLTLPSGACTALVGGNGTGKTTVVKLLTQLYRPDGGRTRADGTPLEELPPEHWRRRTSVVFQDFLRYHLSARENIALGAPLAPWDEDRIRQAAEDAGIARTLAGLPDGFDTPLSRLYPGGTDLSGGQWQRIAIARCLYAVSHGARLVILDEPTAALDVRAEAAFFDEFMELTQGATCLLISHRFSSVRRADRIVRIGGGRVQETGTHDDLISAGGEYARLFRLQAERFR
ncbi:ATP-binding cassette domain-containing protein [Actinomadura sp. B10D3]|uniref:ABC transporter ATP-binding protein n=1 Tax=Actinomadura sp. B10D3 TaxID=3153557 RepID=UPI00325CB037